MNLATLALAWKYLSPELLGEIRGTSYRQVQTIVSRFNPMIKHRDLTRPVAVRKPVEAASERQTVGAPLKGSIGLSLAADEQSGLELGENSLRRGGKNLTAVEDLTPETKMETAKMHQVNCLVDDEVMQLINRCKELMSGKFPAGIDYNTLMQELAIEWLKKHDPVQRAERRENREMKSTTKVQESGETSRHIPPATRDKVYNRDKGRCTYVGSDAKRCNSSWDLEIHHDVTAFAHGGEHSITNLRLLCAAHNKLEAERVFGRRHIDKFCKKQE